jgi:signal transduction histidine kinase
MSGLTGRLRALDPVRLDLAVAAVMIVDLELELWLTGQPSSITEHRGLQTVAAACFALPIAFRRRWSAGSLVGLGAVALTQSALGGNLLDAVVGTAVPPLLVGYGAGAWAEARRGLASLVIGMALVCGAVLLADVGTPPSQHGTFAADLAVMGALIIGSWLAGRLARERSGRETAFRQLATQASAERRQRAQAAIAEEQIRIGRELQDIIIHSVSVMVVQAGGARRLLRTDPARARDAILTIEQTGRDALADLRRLLGVLRKDEDPQALAPQPGLAQVGALVQAHQSQGMMCQVHTKGEPPVLTPGVDLVSYRAVEAALRLLAEHHGRKATVTVGYGPTWLDLWVIGDVTIPDASRELRPVGERLELYDGRLDVDPGDRFSLCARLPLARVVSR